MGYMNKVAIFFLLILSFVAKRQFGQSVPEPWNPPNANYDYPRTLVNKNQLASLKTALAAGVNNDLLNELYIRTLQVQTESGKHIASRKIIKTKE
jgi:hypothetical protein